MKIAGEDIVEGPVVEEPEISPADGLGGYDEEVARCIRRVERSGRHRWQRGYRRVTTYGFLVSEGNGARETWRCFYLRYGAHTH